MTSSWTYPISGEIKKFPDRGEAEFPADVHYFTKSVGGYSVSGVLRSMALFIDGLPDTDSVEAVTVYPEYRDDFAVTWAGMVTVYHDKPAASAVLAAVA